MSLQAIINYDTAGNFTFDADKIDFTTTPGSAQLKKLVYSNETFFASYQSNIDANRSVGSGTGTGTGSPTVANGKLDLTGGGVKYVSYPVTSNADFTNLATIVVGIVPTWTGSAPSTYGFFAVANAPANNSNLVKLVLVGTSIIASIYDSTGTIIDSISGTFSATAGQEAIFALQIDAVTGASKLFVDGVQVGSTGTNTGTRTNVSTICRVGSDNNGSLPADYEVTYFRIFNTVEDISSFIPGFEPTDYDTENPSILLNSGISTDGLDGFAESATKVGNQEVKYTVVVNGQEMYFSGTWQNSDGTYLQSNTATEIESEKASLDLQAGVSLKIKAFLHSEGYDTPTLTSNTIDYNFYNTPDADINECTIYARLDDLLQAVTDYTSYDAKLYVTVNKSFQHGDKIVLQEEFFVPFNTVNGTAEINIIETTSVNVKLGFRITYVDGANTRTISFRDALVPDQADANILNITTIA